VGHISRAELYGAKFVWKYNNENGE
jgi:hypothetical protein